MNLPSLLPKMSCSFLIIFMEKVLWNCIFLAKGCIVEQNSKKETPLKIWFYFQVDINLPMKPFLKLVNDISLIWPKLGKIGFYRPVRTQKLKIFENFCSGVLVWSFGMKKWTGNDCQWHQSDMAKIGQNWLLSRWAGSKMKIFEKFLFRGASLLIWNEKMD